MPRSGPVAALSRGDGRSPDSSSDRLLIFPLQNCFFYTEGCWGEQRVVAHDKDTRVSSSNLLQVWAILSVLSLPPYTFGTP